MEFEDYFIAIGLLILDIGLALAIFIPTIKKENSNSVAGFTKRTYRTNRLLALVFVILAIQKLAKPEWSIGIVFVILTLCMIISNCYSFYIPFKYSKRVSALAVKENVRRRVNNYDPVIEQDAPDSFEESEELLFVYDYCGIKFKVNANATTYTSRIKIEEGLRYKIWINPKNPEDTFLNPKVYFVFSLMMLPVTITFIVMLLSKGLCLLH